MSTPYVPVFDILEFQLPASYQYRRVLGCKYTYIGFLLGINKTFEVKISPKCAYWITVELSYNAWYMIYNMIHSQILSSGEFMLYICLSLYTATVSRHILPCLSLSRPLNKVLSLFLKWFTWIQMGFVDENNVLADFDDKHEPKLVQKTRPKYNNGSKITFI